jgi:hypothetical protein
MVTLLDLSARVTIRNAAIVAIRGARGLATQHDDRVARCPEAWPVLTGQAERGRQARRERRQLAPGHRLRRVDMQPCDGAVKALGPGGPLEGRVLRGGSQDGPAPCAAADRRRTRQCRLGDQHAIESEPLDAVGRRVGRRQLDPLAEPRRLAAEEHVLGTVGTRRGEGKESIIAALGQQQGEMGIRVERQAVALLRRIRAYAEPDREGLKRRAGAERRLHPPAVDPIQDQRVGPAIEDQGAAARGIELGR